VDGLASATLLLNLLLFGTLLVRGRLHRETARLTATIAAPLLAVALGLSAAGLAVKLELFADGEPAIVVSERAPLREGPDPRAEQRGEARAGQRARIVGSDGEFLRVRLQGGGRGWMNQSDLGEIRTN
jgi:hypothetical protein